MPKILKAATRLALFLSDSSGQHLFLEFIIVQSKNE